MLLGPLISICYYYIKKISKFDPIKNSKNDSSKFLAILHRIQLHNTDICRPFIPKIYHLLIKITGSSQVQAIEIITGCSDQPEEMFRELQSKGLSQMITNRYFIIIWIYKHIRMQIDTYMYIYYFTIFNWILGTASLSWRY